MSSRTSKIFGKTDPKMKTKIALLRGINVGGNRKIKMADLRDALTSLNFSNLQTYIQSGNVVFDANSTSSNAEIATAIQQLILSEFGHDVPVVVFGADLLKEITAHNPFKHHEGFLNRLYVSFFNAEPNSEVTEDFNTLIFKGDLFEIHSNYIFVLYETKLSKSKLTNNLIEKELNVQATTRNWKTVLKLLELSN